MMDDKSQSESGLYMKYTYMKSLMAKWNNGPPENILDGKKVKERKKEEWRGKCMHAIMTLPYDKEFLFHHFTGIEMKDNGRLGMSTVIFLMWLFGALLIIYGLLVGANGVIKILTREDDYDSSTAPWYETPPFVYSALGVDGLILIIFIISFSMKCFGKTDLTKRDIENAEQQRGSKRDMDQKEISAMAEFTATVFNKLTRSIDSLKKISS
jgi:hypothetical protein